MDSAKEMDEVNTELAEEFRKDAKKDLLWCALMGGASVSFYIVAMLTEEIKIPISNLSLKIKPNGINLSYKF